MDNDEEKKWMWGGGFNERVDEEIIRFTTSTDIEGFKGADSKLIKYEIQLNYAYILMLIKQGIIDRNIGIKMLKTLREIDVNKIDLRGYEDIHSYIEDILIKETGYTPHICRSRNDEIITLERMYMKEHILKILEELIQLNQTIIDKASKYRSAIIPAYTHWRRADLSTLGHLMTSYTYMFLRDMYSLINYYELIDKSPLGSSAISGCTLPIDREYLADALGFKEVQLNTIDVVSSRWEFQSRYLSLLTIIMKHLASISTDLIILSMDEINLIDIKTKYLTGSSSLPHKKNPDPLEIIIGKTAFIQGILNSVLNLGGTLTGYHRETQEGKWLIIKATEDALDSIRIMNKIIEGVEYKAGDKHLPNQIKYLSTHDISNEISYITRESFRKIHGIVAQWNSQLSGDIYKDIELLYEKLHDNGINFPREHKSRIKMLLNPEYLIGLKKVIGAPGDIDNILKDIEYKLSTIDELIKGYKVKLINQLTSLEKKVDNIIKTSRI